jgi:hypothetical protein
VLQVLHAQRAPRHLVFIGRADALAGGADLAAAVLLARASRARSISTWKGRISGQDSLTNSRERTSMPSASSALDLGQQVRRVDTTTPLPM